MATILGPGGPCTATKIAVDDPGGPLTAGDQLRRDTVAGLLWLLYDFVCNGIL